MKERYGIRNNYSILKGREIYYIYDYLEHTIISEVFDTEEEAIIALGEIDNERYEQNL